ncbi:MAG: hypothetical protein RL619_1520, partial [Bacteroidota bacterium]
SLYFYFNQSSVNFICNEKNTTKQNEMEFFEDLQRIARPIMKKEATTYNDNCLFFHNGERPNNSYCFKLAALVSQVSVRLS